MITRTLPSAPMRTLLTAPGACNTAFPEQGFASACAAGACDIHFAFSGIEDALRHLRISPCWMRRSSAVSLAMCEAPLLD